MKKRANIFVYFFILFFVLVLNSPGEDHFIIGKEDGDGFLAYPRHAQEGPDGNIYVFDWSDFYIKVYSPEGKYLRRIGGKARARVRCSGLMGQTLDSLLMENYTLQKLSGGTVG